MKSSSHLLPDIRRERFLEELAQHQEDSPHPESLGDTQLITEAFNTYAMERRTKSRLIIATITAIAFLFHLSASVIAANNIDTIDVWWEAFIVIPAFIFVIPTVPLTIPLAFFSLSPGDFPILFFPTITALTWAVITYLLLDPPKRLLRHFAKK